MDDYKELIGYRLIKPSVSEFIQFYLGGNSKDIVDEIYYKSKKKCVYIRCFGIQFSFHNIDTKRISPNIISSISNEAVKWDGVRLQPVTLELYILANECQKEDLHDASIIKDRLLNILKNQLNK